jgi:hypothetical protein
MAEEWIGICEETVIAYFGLQCQNLPADIMGGKSEIGTLNS